MNVVHLVGGGSLHGGAAKGAYTLHRALLEIGVRSTFVTNGYEDTADPTIVRLSSGVVGRAINSLGYRVGNLPVAMYPRRHRMIFNTGLAGRRFKSQNCLKSADVVNLHWINGLVSLKQISEINQPIVWTLRDMWPFTGGCHLGAVLNCDRFTAGCGYCPQLRSGKENDLSRLIYGMKLKYVRKNVNVVGVSEWIAEAARKSKLFSSSAVTTIYNGIDTRIFFKEERIAARRHLSLPVERKIVLVGSQSSADTHKGFQAVCNAKKILKDERVLYVTFGRSGTRPGTVCKDGFLHLGYLSTAEQLRYAYSAADVYVSPSLLDAFGKTIAEAQACGTPVVCFDGTGPREIVEHKATGYRATLYDTNDLAKGIRWVLDMNERLWAELSNQSRVRAISMFDSLVAANKYLMLYESLIKNGRRGL
jgi:glycosyltransferase involved in cell wall biosynthesis